MTQFSIHFNFYHTKMPCISNHGRQTAAQIHKWSMAIGHHASMACDVRVCECERALTESSCVCWHKSVAFRILLARPLEDYLLWRVNLIKNTHRCQWILAIKKCLRSTTSDKVPHWWAFARSIYLSIIESYLYVYYIFCLRVFQNASTNDGRSFLRRGLIVNVTFRFTIDWARCSVCYFRRITKCYPALQWWWML